MLGTAHPVQAEGAQPSTILPGAVSMHMGFGDGYKRATLSWESTPLWSYQFSGRGGRLDLTGELGVSYWWANKDRNPRNAWQLSAIPMLRYWATEKFYLEAGIGATVFSGSGFAGKNISTAYQFGDHVGAGYQITPSDRIGVRYSHFSNAGIKRPNPGLDIIQVTYTRKF
ncbi:acyloxyacyl hydrolase [Cupriavidus basilensis]|uniref:Acyloxyacyl hydrolase n=1 Tax=Cupriavidus basilensis TaxID=68895 RepID=A0ABT6B4D9_9BURK|nr:acyloxyacyl hydrolase [Cupriavidus basilensis]MDF3839322.1 acyloxyacyl hydrolase [Cupriavidus basilensis]